MASEVEQLSDERKSRTVVRRKKKKNSCQTREKVEQLSDERKIQIAYFLN